MLQLELLEARAPPFSMVLSQKHCPLYSTPARRKPAALQAAVQRATVMFAEAMEFIWVVRARPVVPSAQQPT